MIDGSITGDPEEIGTVNRVERQRAVSLMGAERLKNPVYLSHSKKSC